MKNTLTKLKQSKGFTLVEILIVVIIVGLLAGIAVSKLGDSKERAVISVKKSAASEINKAVQAAYVKGAGHSLTVGTGSTSAVLDLLTELQANTLVGDNGQVVKPFTDASVAEMRANVQDATPRTGRLEVRNPTPSAGLRDVEVVFSATGGPNT